jgi:phage baseplate assembly protein W
VAGRSPKLPLGRDSQDGYALNKTLRQVARQNLKMLILTSPGERIMLPEFGVGIRHYLFENATDEAFLTLRSRIMEQARMYLPYITINSVNFREETGEGRGSFIEPSSTTDYLHIVIDYSVYSDLASETLIINL